MWGSNIHLKSFVSVKIIGSGEEEAAPESLVFRDPDPFNEENFHDDLNMLHSTPAPAAPPAPCPSAPSLTEEQRLRIELNRQQALERKLARQQQQQTGERHFICLVIEKISFVQMRHLRQCKNRKNQMM